ncbi:MAG: threonine/serine exporter family protein [Clostridia bacterium]|nr:threonine/serine exporter family protein [Clostridia bacterium]
MKGRTFTVEKQVCCDEALVLDAAMEAGHILLQNGAEISRVEETMSRICKHYGVESGDFFVMGNGIMTTGGTNVGGSYARVRYIPVMGSRLDRVIAVNQLSREISEGKYEDIAKVKQKLEEIKNLPEKKIWKQIVASGMGSGFFCVLSGGGLWDSTAAFFVGVLLYVFVLFVTKPHFNKIVGNIFGGIVAALLCIVFYLIGFGHNLSCMMSGAVMPLVPGVAFTNGIRDIAGGDYISGSVRLLDAALVFISIAIGVGVMLSVYRGITGGILL